MQDNLRDVLDKIDDNGNLAPKEEPVVIEPIVEKEDPIVEPEVEETDPKGNSDEEETLKAKEDPTQTKESSVIRTLRQNAKEAKAELEKIRSEADAERKTLEKMATKRGITVNQLKKQLEEEDLVDEAKTMNMTPEALAAQKRLEEEIKQLRQDGQRRDFLGKIDVLQNKLSLTDADLEDFVQKASASGIDLLNPNIKFEDAYYALNRQAIEARIREEERQKVLKDIERQKTKGPTNTKKTGTGDGGKKGINDLYQDLAKLQNI